MAESQNELTMMGSHTIHQLTELKMSLPHSKLM